MRRRTPRVEPAVTSSRDEPAILAPQLVPYPLRGWPFVWPGRSGVFLEIPEGDRISECLDAGNAVFPFPAGWSAQEIGGAWFGRERDAIPLVAIWPAQPEVARRQQREADDVSKYRPILVPANTGAIAVFNDQHLLELAGVYVSKPSGFFPEREQKFGNVFGFVQRMHVEIVAPAKGDRAAFAGESLKFKFLERQVANVIHQLMFFINSQHTILIPKSLRKSRRW